jgi:hypothetical protein
MKKIQQFTVLWVIITLFYVMVSPIAMAQNQERDGVDNTQPFGGFISFMQPCTCSAPIQWFFMAPLHLGAPVPVVGPLSFNPLKVLPFNGLFSGFNANPGNWLLGRYQPGQQTCEIVIGTGCIILPVLGDITATGTSDKK